MPGSALLLAALALAAPGTVSVGVPAEVDLVGLAAGLHPEVLYAPNDGAFHLRAGAGWMVGPELSLVPLTVGIRELAFPRKAVSVGGGLGLQLQGFFPDQHAPVGRLDVILELAGTVRVDDDWKIAGQLSPELGLVGGFGFGFAARVGVQRAF